MEDTIRDHIRASIAAKERLAAETTPVIARVGAALISALRAGHRVWLAGNGGSAADAQHIACELVGRFRRERRGLPVQALTVDPSIMTALANDFGFDRVFERQVEAHVGEGDVFIGISTSGGSANLLQAVDTARTRGAVTIGLLGKGGGALADRVDIALIVPSGDTQRIQECHTTIGHILCDLVEQGLAGTPA